MRVENSINLGICDNVNDDARTDRRKTNINKILGLHKDLWTNRYC